MNFNEKIKKFGGLPVLILGVFAALLLLSLLMGSLNSARNMGIGLSNSSGSFNSPMMPSVESMDYGGSRQYAPSLSMRNVNPALPPTPGGYPTPGDDSEAYEVKSYSVYIETRNLERDCAVILNLYARADVIFENRREGRSDCNFTFKVSQAQAAEVLTLIETLDPRDVSEYAYTIKREVNDYASALDALKQKLDSLDATLAEATQSYNSITNLATSRGDVENLAKIIESKLTILERLTLLRIDTINQIDSLERSKAEALDRLIYTYFTVSIAARPYLDGDTLADSWRTSVRQFIIDANTLLEDLSLGLLSLLLGILKYGLYFVILLVTARFGWTFSQRVWERGGTKTDPPTSL